MISVSVGRGPAAFGKPSRVEIKNDEEKNISANKCPTYTRDKSST